MRAEGARAVLAGLVILGSAPAGWSQVPGAVPQESVAGTGRQLRQFALKFKVVLIAADLSLKPVPKKAFTVCALPDLTRCVPLTTSFQGEASVDLAPGAYRISTTGPIEFEGKRYSWSVDLAATEGGASTVELSNDNATISNAEVVKSLSQVVTDEGRIFQRVKGSVFKVESESGHGSGFLVDDRGLVLTNNHVVKGSSFLAVKISETSRFAASLVTTDETNDLAVLRVNPSAVKGLAALDLASDSLESPPLGIGERVVAVGSPLTSETILTSGIVSKIEQEAIFSDVNINHGNSGGPLFDLTGKVVGITTFMLPTTNGPGVSGVVRIYLAQALLEQAKQQLATAQVPPPHRLPVESTYRFPPAALKDVANTQRRNLKDYHLAAQAMDVQFVTPVLIACLETEREKELARAHGKKANKAQDYVPGKDFYEWERYTGDYRPVVSVQAIPEITMTGESALRVIMFGSGVHQNLRFKDDFVRMELWRDGVVVEPILPGRIPHEVDQSIGNKSMRDLTHFGAYEYLPEAFRPGVRVELRVWDETRGTPLIVERLSQATLELIWGDFAPYFEALQKEVATQGRS